MTNLALNQKHVLASQFFILGTAQFGFHYGIANEYGKPDDQTVINMTEKAIRSGVTAFDTAQAYGESEAVLGRCFEKLGSKNINVISKLEPASNLETNEQIEASVENSVKKLHVSQLYALLLHRAEPLKHSGARFQKIFSDLKKRNLIRYSGVSIYDENEFDLAIRQDWIDCIQIPFNLFDQRALELGWFGKATEKGKQLFLRSIFLQGLFFLDPKKLPEHMQFARPALEKLNLLCNERNQNIKDLALSFILTYGDGCLPVIGMETMKQLEENLDLIKRLQEKKCLSEAVSFYQEIQKDPNFRKIINPSLWKAS